MTFASGRTTLRLTPTSDQSIGRRQGPGPGAATGLQPRRHPGRRPEAPGRPRPRPPDRHRARHLHRAISGLTVRCFRTVRRPDGWCPAPVARLVSVAMLVSGRSQAWTGCPAAHRMPATSVDEYSLPQPPQTWQLYAARKTNQSGTAATAGPGRLSEHGQRRPAWSPVARARTGRLCRRPCRTLALWPSGMASRFRTPRPDGRVQWSSSGTGG